MTIQEKAEKYLQFFEQKEVKRGNEEVKNITVLKDNRPYDLQDSIYKAHGEKLPSDWVFSTYESILSSITEYDSQDLDEIRHEIVDGLVSVYTSDLTAWLHDTPNNVYYLSQALEETETKDGFQALQYAQYTAIDEIFSEVAKLLQGKEEVK